MRVSLFTPIPRGCGLIYKSIEDLVEDLHRLAGYTSVYAYKYIHIYIYADENIFKRKAKIPIVSN